MAASSLLGRGGPVLSTRDVQMTALKNMLSVNSDENSVRWKVRRPLATGTLRCGRCVPPLQVLVYDTFGSDILSPLLTVGELRELGVTLHLSLSAARDPIPGAVGPSFSAPYRCTVP